jgi:cytosine/adenosine deaminase-related metal-dependent hydrolase
MILRAKRVLNREFHFIENGSISIDADDGLIDLGDSILLPGLINAHCHLDYTGMKGMIPKKEKFTDWIREINQLKNSWSVEDFKHSILQGLEESMEFGTTSLVNWICSPEWVPSTAELNSRIWWLWEQITIRSQSNVEDWDRWIGKIAGASPLWKAGLAPHAPYTCSPDAVQKMAQWSGKRGLPWSMHVSESMDEMLMFKKATGTLHQLFQDLKRDMSDCGGHSPCEVVWNALRGQEKQSQLLMVHANFLEESDFTELKKLQQLGGKIAVVHCPRSHSYFQREPFSVDQFKRNGIRICLGTDSLASNDDLSMFAEMNHMRKLYPELSPREVLEMTTLHSLDALGVRKEWNSWNDWIAIPNHKPQSNIWENITTFTGKPHFIMINGKVYKK